MVHSTQLVANPVFAHNVYGVLPEMTSNCIHKLDSNGMEWMNGMVKSNIRNGSCMDSYVYRVRKLTIQFFIQNGEYMRCRTWHLCGMETWCSDALRIKLDLRVCYSVHTLVLHVYMVQCNTKSDIFWSIKYIDYNELPYYESVLL